MQRLNNLMRKIEFLGASGVGKTYIFNRLIESRSTINDNWVTPGEVKIKIAKSIGNGCFPLNRRTAMRYNLFKNKHSEWAEDILRKYYVEAFDKCLSTYQGLVELLINGLTRITYINSFDKIKICDFYISCIKRIAVLDYFNVSDLVVFDDGIIHNNFGIIDFLSYKNIACPTLDIKSKINPVAVVFCKLSLEDNLIRRKKRIAENNGTFLEKKLNDSQLRLLCEKSLEDSQNKVEIMKTMGVPVLEVDMTRNQNENIIDILRFIKNFV